MSDRVDNGPKLPLFRREERHELRYQLSIGMATALSWIAWAMPFPMRMRVADAFGVLFYHFSTTYSANVEHNVRQVLGPDVSEAEVAACVKSIFRTSARNFVDLLVMPRWNDAHFLNVLDVVEGDFSIVRDALALGKGVIFVTGHVGCFDFIGQALRSNGFPLTIVTGRTTSRFVFDGVTHLRSAHGNLLVEPTPSGVRRAYRTVRQNGCAVIVSDRDFFQNGRPIDFFGKRTTLPPGAVRIARDTGAMVVPVISHRKGKRHGIQILDPFTIDKTRDIDQDLDTGLRRIASALEYGIRSHVEQWAMFQRVWPEHAPAPVRVFPVGSPLESELLERVASALPERKTPARRRRARTVLSPLTALWRRLRRSGTSNGG